MTTTLLFSFTYHSFAVDRRNETKDVKVGRFNLDEWSTTLFCDLVQNFISQVSKALRELMSFFQVNVKYQEMLFSFFKLSTRMTQSPLNITHFNHILMTD